jgi:hypothetical protein
LFLASPQTKYYVIYDSSFQNEISNLQKNAAWNFLNVEFATSVNALTLDEPDAKFVFVTASDADDVPGLYDEDLRGVHINNQGALFLKRVEGQSSWSELGSRVPVPKGVAPLMAAIIAQDQKMLEESLANMYRGLSRIAAVHRERLTLLGEDSPAECVYDGSFGANQLEALVQYSSDLSVDPNNIPAIQQIESLAGSLADENERLVDKSCPTIM